jgi:hypothetical protein
VGDRYSVITAGKAASDFVYHFSVFGQTAFAVDLLVPNNLDGSLTAVADDGVPGATGSARCVFGRRRSR